MCVFHLPGDVPGGTRALLIFIPQLKEKGHEKTFHNRMSGSPCKRKENIVIDIAMLSFFIEKMLVWIWDRLAEGEQSTPPGTNRRRERSQEDPE